MKQSRNIILILLVICIILLITYFMFGGVLYKKYNGNGGIWYLYSVEDKIKNKKYTQSSSTSLESNVSYDYSLLGSFKCGNKDNNCHVYGIDTINNIAVVLDDNIYYLYNINEKTRKKLTLSYDKEIIDINLIVSPFDKKIYGLSIGKSGTDSIKYGLYDYEQDKMITEYIYEDLTYAGKNYHYAVGTIKDEENDNQYKLDVLEIATGKVVKSFASSDVITYYEKSEVYLVTNEMLGVVATDVLDLDLNSIVQDRKLIDANINSDNSITIAEYNNFYTIDSKGNATYTSPRFMRIYKVVKDYVIGKDENNMLIIMNKSGDVKATYNAMTENYAIHTLLSGYTIKNDKIVLRLILDNTDVENGQKGCVVNYYYYVETGNSESEFASSIAG